MMTFVMYVSALVVVALSGCGYCHAQASTDHEIAVVNKRDGITLAGTLTLPTTAPKAVIVLATGSGAQNRDEEVLGIRPFKVIADSLSACGYAVARFDDRGVGGSGGSPDFDTNDYASDIRSIFDTLDSIVGKDTPKGVLGHSEGGLTAIKVANEDPRCSFIVTLAAPAWAGDFMVMSQTREMATATAGTWQGEAAQRNLLNLVKSDMPDYSLRIALYAALAQVHGDAATIPAVKERIAAEIEALTSRSYRNMIKYDPTVDIAAVAQAWLAINGDRDMQVLPGNLATIGELNPNVTTVLLPGLNHLFQRADTGLPTEYPTLGDPDAAMLDAITTFLNALYGVSR